jgi:hypothetical protein
VKSLLIVAAAVAVLALGALAIGGAATSAQEDDGLLGSFLAKVADKLGVSEDELNTAIQDAKTETIDEAVADGRLTEKQAERLKERVGEGGFLFPPGLPPDGLHMRGGPGFMADAAAEALGMNKDELIEALKDGNSLAEMAEAQGMDLEDFKAALLDQVKAQLGEVVAAGDLTQEQADDIFQRTEENIDSIVDAEGCDGGFGGMRHGPGGFGGPGFGPFFDEGAEATEEADVTA